LQQFKALDREGKGVRREMVPKGRALPFEDFFDVADHDGDGVLTEKELLAFLDLLELAPLCAVTLGCADGGRGLFELLDADGDGRLNLHEMRTAWTRLAPFADAEGRVSKEDLPRQVQVTVQQGTTDAVNLQRQPVRVPGPAAPR